MPATRLPTSSRRNRALLRRTCPVEPPPALLPHTARPMMCIEHTRSSRRGCRALGRDVGGGGGWGRRKGKILFFFFFLLLRSATDGLSTASGSPHFLQGWGTTGSLPNVSVCSAPYEHSSQDLPPTHTTTRKLVGGVGCLVTGSPGGKEGMPARPPRLLLLSRLGRPVSVLTFASVAQRFHPKEAGCIEPRLLPTPHAQIRVELHATNKYEPAATPPSPLPPEG